MMHRLLSTCLKYKTCASLWYSLMDFSEVLHLTWNIQGFIIVATVVFWIPALKFACFAYNTLGCRFFFKGSPARIRAVLKSGFWVTAIVATINYIQMCFESENLIQSIFLGAFICLLLIWDYLEIEETLRKIEKEDKDS